jgi:hypothetical protein
MKRATSQKRPRVSIYRPACAFRGHLIANLLRGLPTNSRSKRDGHPRISDKPVASSQFIRHGGYQGEAIPLSAAFTGSFRVGRYTLDFISEFEGPRILPREPYPTLQETHLSSIIPHLPKDSFDTASGKIATIRALSWKDGSRR